jgi:hypothetical protein
VNQNRARPAVNAAVGIAESRHRAPLPLADSPEGLAGNRRNSNCWVSLRSTQPTDFQFSAR